MQNGNSHAQTTEIGVVTGDKTAKTRRVEIPRLVGIRKYGKYLRRKTVCYVHDENNESHAGDTVEIIESRPLSRPSVGSWCAWWRRGRASTGGHACRPARVRRERGRREPPSRGRWQDHRERMSNHDSDAKPAGRGR